MSQKNSAKYYQKYYLISKSWDGYFQKKKKKLSRGLVSTSRVRGQKIVTFIIKRILSFEDSLHIYYTESTNVTEHQAL